MPKDARKISLLSGMCGQMSCKTHTRGSQVAQHRVGVVELGVCQPQEPHFHLGEALEHPCLSPYTREPAVRVQSLSWGPAFLPGQSHQIACPKQHSWGILPWLPGLIWSSISRPVSRLIRRSGSLPKASDMVRLLWNMKSWERFAAAA